MTTPEHLRTLKPPRGHPLKSARQALTIESLLGWEDAVEILSPVHLHRSFASLNMESLLAVVARQ